MSVPEPRRRVALVLASSTGGIGRHVASLTAGLAGLDVEVTVCGPVDTDRQFDFTLAGARFVPVEIPASPQPRDAAAVHALRRALRAAAPDLVHAHGLRAGLVAALARPTGCPLVVTWHNQVLAQGVRGRVYRQLEGYVARAADVTLGASADLVNRAAALGARDARLGAVAAPELAPVTRSAQEVREELGIAPDRPMVLSVGRLHPQKGYDVLVAAASRWRARQPVPVVVIAGSGPAYMRLAGQISEQRAPVVLAGHRTDVPDLLAAADLAVVTSVWEARQLFAQEAMRAGTPLVATSVGGLPELVGDAALLVPPGDIDALDDAVRSLLDDRGLRAEYGRRGAERAATWPTEADTLAQVCAVYDEVAGAVRGASQEAR
ncbi:glycosyltransferase family 4 protein [Planosporangium flavigriseum]|uniref:Glycosyl transferase n=1 Tax=Planosporangium flavigriseum TaxID=373681 RepID=A0A8J3LRC8_9ACTN|nr:glycosyltransferase family 4 protein [Planosporangium flavigriseum]NJC67823.1 glycosyltransferase family 4 protein [Planosporangium flavigriseum]GIG76199.1 glycosyl transferase [Planosporangium flavigriseum]